MGRINHGPISCTLRRLKLSRFLAVTRQFVPLHGFVHVVVDQQGHVHQSFIFDCGYQLDKVLFHSF
jgi:hypothetical protein